MRISGKIFDFKNRTYLMGILNITPDSFYDGGKNNAFDAALRRTEQMLSDGADMIDVGGESTRPGHTQIAEAEEIERVAPVIEAVKKRFDTVVSVDTYKAPVAAAAVLAGADVVNDIWGFKYDPEIARVTAQSGAACVLMHNRDTTEYTDFWRDIARELTECVALAKKAGIADDKIILDPGLGFGKTAEQNLVCMNGLQKLKALGFPLLIGASNKSFIGAALGASVGERLSGTLAVTAYSVLAGAAIVRVHNVKENKDVIRMLEAFKDAKDNG